MIASPTMETSEFYGGFASDLLNYIEFVQRLNDPTWERESVWSEVRPGHWEVHDSTVEALLPPEWLADPETFKEITAVLDNAALNEWSVFTDYMDEHPNDDTPYTYQQCCLRLFCYVVAWTWQVRGWGRPSAHEA